MAVKKKRASRPAARNTADQYRSLQRSAEAKRQKSGGGNGKQERSTQAPAYKGSGKLEGKVALITGADSGIGRAVGTTTA